MTSLENFRESVEEEMRSLAIEGEALEFKATQIFKFGKEVTVAFPVGIFDL